jgi:Tol biopolymer transport system component
VFAGGPPGKPKRIYVVPATGGAVRQLTSGDTGADGELEASWSPDGASIVFSGYPESAVKGSVLRTVDMKTGRIAGLPGSEGMWSPRWSPDGRRIAAISAKGWHLVLYDLRTRSQVELHAGPVGYPSWSRDGQYLFLKTGAKADTIVRVRVRDRKAETITILKGMILSEWGWFALTSSDSLLFAREISTDEIYAVEWDGR